MVIIEVNQNFQVIIFLSTNGPRVKEYQGNLSV